METSKKDKTPTVNDVKRNVDTVLDSSKPFREHSIFNASSWQFVFATLAVSAAVYYGLQSRDLKTAPEYRKGPNRAYNPPPPNQVSLNPEISLPPRKIRPL